MQAEVQAKKDAEKKKRALEDEKILKEQIPDYKKQTLADIIIKSDRGKRYLYQAIIKTIKKVKNKKNRKIYEILKEF